MRILIFSHLGFQGPAIEDERDFKGCFYNAASICCELCVYVIKVKFQCKWMDCVRNGKNLDSNLVIVWGLVEHISQD